MLQDCPACNRPLDPTPEVTASYIELRLLGEMGDEVTYAGYARVRIARDAASWTIVNGVATNLVPISFPESRGFALAFYVEVVIDGATVGRAAVGPSMIIPFTTPVFSKGNLSIGG